MEFFIMYLAFFVDENETVRSLPPLKIQSPLTPHLKGLFTHMCIPTHTLNHFIPLTYMYTAFSSLSRKRGHSPPPYVIHRLAGGKALAPPCPAYGIQQPLEKDGK